MSKLQQLIDELCPDGVEYHPIGMESVSKDIIAGATPSKSVASYWEGGTIPWMSSGEVNNGTIYETTTRITQEAYDSCSTKLVPKNSIVVALAGQGKTRGKVARTRIPLCTNQSLATIIPSEQMSCDFLFHYLNSKYAELRSISSGDGNRGGLTLSMIRSFKIPVPPLPVQEEIVRILDTFTELEAELEAELVRRKQQYAYYREQLLTFDNGVEGGASSEWVKLGQVGEFRRGSTITKADFTNDGVPCFHYGQVFTRYSVKTHKTFAFVDVEFAKKKRMIQPGELFIATTSENDDDVAKAVAWLGSKPAVAGSDAVVFQHNLEPRYASYLFTTQHFHKQKTRFLTGTKVRRISAQSLAMIKVLVPPLEVQKDIADKLDAFDALVNDLTAGLPAEIAARRKQYEYYREQLLTFPEKKTPA